MANRKKQTLKQKIATSGHSDKFSRRMLRLAQKIERVGQIELAKTQSNEKPTY